MYIPDNEGKTCDAVVRLLEKLTGETRKSIRNPEEDGVGPPIDLRLRLGTNYIDPRSPWQNLYIESFNSIFRTTFLNRWCFLTLAETKALTRQ